MNKRYILIDGKGFKMDEQEQSIKDLLVSIAHAWIRQEKNNCEDKREESLPRYNLIYRAGFPFHYELRLWIGTSLGIDCDNHDMPDEDWTAMVSEPIGQNTRGKAIDFVIGTRKIIEGRAQEPTRHYFHTVDTIGILPQKYEQYYGDIDDPSSIVEILTELRQVIENRT
jgi:hypothetical protein